MLVTIPAWLASGEVGEQGDLPALTGVVTNVGSSVATIF